MAEKCIEEAEKLGLTEEESTTRYIDALQVVFQGRYPVDTFCLTGYRECAICLERNGARWVVYSGERGNRYDEVQCDTVLMACLQIMRKMSNNVEEISTLEREFIDMLCIPPKTAEDIFEDLAQSRDSYEKGECEDFDSALDEISKRYDL